MKYLISDDTLKDMADAIREKSGEQDLIQPKDYAGAIRDLSTSGDVLYFDTLVNVFKNSISSDLSHISIGLNPNITATRSKYDSCFSGSKIEKIPTFIDEEISGQYIFNKCKNLKEVHKESFPNLKAMGSFSLFQGCSSLRYVDSEIVNKCDGYNYTFEQCRVIDEIIDIDSNSFGSCSGNGSALNTGCGRLSRLTFKTKANGEPYIGSFKGRVIDLSGGTTTSKPRVGFLSPTTQATEPLNLGAIKPENQIIDSASYERLKNNPDS